MRMVPYLIVTLCALPAACAQIAGLQEGRRAPDAHSAAGGGAGGSAATGAAGGLSGAGGTVGNSGGSGGIGGGSTGGFAGYAAAVMADGPVAYYRLDEAVTPTAVDATGHGNDGVYKGGVTLGVPGALSGDSDTAAHFDGTGSVDLGARFGFQGKVPFTLEFWVKPEAAPFAVFSKASYNTGYSGWFFGEGTGGTDFRFRRVNAASTTGLALNVWTYVVGTFDGQTLVLYLNAHRVASQVDSSSLSVVNSSTLIGTSADWMPLTGSVDEVAVYDKVLPLARITAHYKAAIAP